MLEDDLGVSDALERQVTALVPELPWAREIARPRWPHGSDSLTALGLCTEIGNSGRFRQPGQLMSYLGQVPLRIQALRLFAWISWRLFAHKGPAMRRVA